MRDQKVKICGVNNLSILEEIVNLEIDFVGFIFFEKSPRNLNNNFLELLTDFNFKKTKPVCVYVNPDEEFVYKTSSYLNNPILQFHGDEDSSFCESFGLEYWKAIRIKDKEDFIELKNYDSALAILMENHKDGFYGGTGESFNWELLKNINTDRHNLILSGGINSQNVDNALTTKSWCIDINSGVESEVGKKDINLIKNIVNKINNHDF